MSARNLTSSGGLEGRQPPSMMFEEALVQIGVQSLES